MKATLYVLLLVLVGTFMVAGAVLLVYSLFEWLLDGLSHIAKFFYIFSQYT